MSDSAGFNIDDLIQAAQEIEGGETETLKVEQLPGKFRRLQQDKRALEEEVTELESVMESLQEELETLQAEAYQQEGILNQKEELCRNLQSQCDESERETTRQLEQNKKSDELLGQYSCEMQEIQLKQRKQRLKFLNQLSVLTEQHKNLSFVFSPTRLPAEIESSENTIRQLLLAEQMKLAQLHSLEEELEEVKKQKQTGTASAETEDEQKAAL